MNEQIIDAREAAIEEKASGGSPYSGVVQRGIRSGQFDNGSIVRKHIEKEQKWKTSQSK
jgi:hypothetical protein